MKKILLILLIIISVLSVNAQRRSGISAYNFIPDFYIGGNIGPNAFLADGYSEYGFKGCYGLSESVFMGYNLSEILGVRALASFSNLTWPGVNSQNIFEKKFSTMAMSVEAVYNFSNTFDIYNLNRPLDFSIFAGVGFISREKLTFNNEYLGYVVKGGLQLDYRLNFKLDLSAQADFNILDENFNEKSVGIPFDLVPEFKVGLTYHMRTNRRFR
ncbi:MAG: outer membrane beta-barrel protein [Paludibacter sp.]